MVVVRPPGARPDGARCRSHLVSAPGELDKFGSVLVVTEHSFHPTFLKNGWDRIGGPEFTINGQRFAFDDDSSSMAEFLFPARPKWFEKAATEANRVVEQLA